MNKLKKLEINQKIYENYEQIMNQFTARNKLILVVTDLTVHPSSSLLGYLQRYSQNRQPPA